MLQTDGGRPVHMPANPNVFEFDAEVSRIFPDMAKRAIPMYHEGHRAHVAMLSHFLASGYREVLDIGASRGAFLQHIRDQLSDSVEAGMIHMTAVDSSEAMVQYLVNDFPEAKVYHDDITRPRTTWAMRQYDVVALYYVLQFVSPKDHVSTLERVLNRVKPGGFFVFGHKEALSGPLGQKAQDEYIEFRMRNGYSAEEIRAKTTALKGAMFQLTNAEVLDQVRNAGFIVQETVRWMAFNAFIAQKVA